MNRTYGKYTHIHGGDHIHIDFLCTSSNECQIDARPGQKDARTAGSALLANSVTQYSRVPFDASNAATKLVHHSDPVVISEHQWATVTAARHLLADDELKSHVLELASLPAANEYLDVLKSGISKHVSFITNLAAGLDKKNTIRNTSLIAGLLMILLAWLVSTDNVVVRPENASVQAPNYAPAQTAQEQINDPAADVLAADTESVNKIQATLPRSAVAPSIYILNQPVNSDDILGYKHVFEDLLKTAIFEKLEANAQMILSTTRSGIKSSGSLTSVTGGSGGIEKAALNLEVSAAEIQFQAPETIKVKSFLTDAEILRSLDRNITEELRADAAM